MARLKELRFCCYRWRPLPHQDQPMMLVEPSNMSPLSTLHVVSEGEFDLSYIRSNTISDLVIEVPILPNQAHNLVSLSAAALKSLAIRPFAWGGVPIHIPNLISVTTLVDGMGFLPEMLLCPNIIEVTLFDDRPIIKRPAPSTIQRIPCEFVRVLIMAGPFSTADLCRITLQAIPTVTTIVWQTFQLGFWVLLNTLSSHPHLLPSLTLIQAAQTYDLAKPFEATQIRALSTFFETRPQVRIECAELPRRTYHGGDLGSLAMLKENYIQRFSERPFEQKDLRYLCQRHIATTKGVLHASWDPLEMAHHPRLESSCL